MRARPKAEKKVVEILAKHKAVFAELREITNVPAKETTQAKAVRENKLEEVQAIVQKVFEEARPYQEIFAISQASLVSITGPDSCSSEGSELRVIERFYRPLFRRLAMRAFAKVACVVAVAVPLLPAQRSDAEIMLYTIQGFKDCPDGLIIKSKAADGGMIQFDVYVDSDAIAKNELYKGRTRSKAVLKIATAQEQIASVVVHGSPEGKGGERAWYQFSLAPSAAKTSELQLGVSLYEKDGMPTVGGGRSMRIYLAGFQPKMERTRAKPE